MQATSVDIPFDAIFTLLIFLIGIPALIFQFMTPEIRRIVLAPQRRCWLAVDVFLPMGAALLVSLAGIVTEFRFGDLSPYEHNLRWVYIFSALTFITLIIGIRIPMRYGRREAIVETLKREIKRSLKKQGYVAETAWEDLIDIGKNATLPQERKLVLDALHELAREIYHHPAYGGDGLESLIMGVVDIISQGGGAVSGENYQVAAAILQDVALNADEVHQAADLRRAIKAAGEIGRIALVKFDSGLEGDNIVMKFVEVLGLVLFHPAHSPLASDVTEALFDIGSLAFELDRPLIGMAALGKMTSLLSSANGFSAEQRNEQLADTLGLLAHCWAKGDAHREIVHQRLAEIEAYLFAPLPQMFEMAYGYYLDRTKLETASKLTRMADELGHPLKA